MLTQHGAPLPRYGAKTDIDIAGQVNAKRLAARGYRRSGVPLWLVVGIAADFGELEAVVDDVIAEVVETLPFHCVVAVDDTRVEAVPLVLDRERHDLLGRAWHEAGHAVAAVRLGIPLVSTTIERSHGSENRFTEIASQRPPKRQRGRLSRPRPKPSMSSRTRFSKTGR